MSWYEALLQRAEAAYVRGDTETAVDLFEEAERRALAEGDQDRSDRAYCNRSTILIDLERGSECIPRLKQILLRSRDDLTRWMASYATAMASYMASDLDIARAYARRARDLAASLADPVRIAATTNLQGNVAMLTSEFEEAEWAYEQALLTYDGRDGHDGLMAAQIRDNLGYVHLCTDRLASGIQLCDQARSEMETLGAEHYLQQPLQDLCYGYLLSNDLETARECGEQSFALAVEIDDRLVVKNCLFLLAEIAVRQDDRFRARRFLSELAHYYPELAISDELIDVFMDMDLTRVVNLRG